ncbi:MAG TPA: hypothetical protein VKV04_18670 [Verrucomicrobiae bacterium]|nr:hypothetical protein [Verrucomicrobiae bacterium]
MSRLWLFIIKDTMTDGRTLVAEYVQNGSEEAFEELVARYIDLVYSSAIRLMDGDIHLAQDVSQSVFTDLARSAKSLPPDIMIGGWLHRHTCFVVRNTLRSERRRQLRERRAVEMNY